MCSTMRTLIQTVTVLNVYRKPLRSPILGRGIYYILTIIIRALLWLLSTGKVNQKNYVKELVDVQLGKEPLRFTSQSMGPLCWLANTELIKTRNKRHQKLSMLSTCHQATMERIGWRNAGVEVMKPTIGGVDHVDQQLHNLHTVRKTYKWYKKLAVCFILQATLNSHKVYQRRTWNYEMDFLKYLHDVIALLVIHAPCMANDVPINETVTLLTGRHFPSLKKAREGAKDKHPSKQCRVCDACRLCASCPSKAWTPSRCLLSK